MRKSKLPDRPLPELSRSQRDLVDKAIIKALGLEPVRLDAVVSFVIGYCHDVIEGGTYEFYLWTGNAMKRLKRYGVIKLVPGLGGGWVLATKES